MSGKEKIELYIDVDDITLKDIEEYLNSIGKSVIDTAELDILEDRIQNYPG